MTTMIKRLQDISFRVSRYFRPLQTWHCGGMEDGSQCLLGPDKNGTCRAINDCAPEQEGKTWKCTRSELLGGPCKAGPSNHGACGRQRPPCKPVRSIRSRRSRFMWLAAAASLALTALVITVDNWQVPTNAGQLSKHHAAFGEQQCEACHGSVEQPRASLLQRAIFGSDAHSQISDAQRCTSCHVLGENSLAIHSLPAEKLSAITEAAQSREAERSETGEMVKVSLMLNAARALRDPQAEAPICSTCHQEHLGSGADLTAVSDQQCAVCHSDAFDNFSDHTAFTNYPAARRTAIIFSHNTHLNKHFAEEDLVEIAPQACADCHISDAIDRKMEVKGFDQTCSGCHLSQVTGESRAGDKGFAMLSIPAVDVDTLNERGVNIGHWPEYSDAEFTPLNYLLVAATAPRLKDQLATFKALDLYDLSSASDDELRLVYDVLWTLKQVYFEMQRGGARTVSRKLTDVLPSASNAAEGEIFGLLSPAVIDRAVNDAFPDLDAEVLRWLQQNEPAFALKAASKPAPVVEEKPQQVASAADDDWLSGALDDSGEDEADDDWLSGALDDDEGAEDATDDDWLSGAADSEEEAEGDDWLSGALDDDEGDGDDWLSEASGDTASALDDDALSEEDIDDAGDDQGGNGKVVEVLEKLSLEDRTAAGGWYYENYYLRYRPSGHADRLIVAWVERLTSGHHESGIAGDFASSMQVALLGGSTPGSCLKCHSVDLAADDSGPAKVNWFGAKTPPSVHDFNAFSHGSHFALVDESQEDFAAEQDAGCRSCHKLDSESDSAVAYEDDAVAFQSDFHDLQVEQCASCHQPQAALANCTQCHNYHIGDRGLSGVEDGFRSRIGGKTLISSSNVP